MANTPAVASQGAQLKININNTATLIPYIMGFTGPSIVQDFEETTNLDSTGGFKEWYATIRDGGTIPFQIIASNNNAVHNYLETSNHSGSLEAFTLAFPSPMTKVYTFSGFVQKYEPQFQQSKVVKYSAEVKVTGNINVA